MRTLPRLLLTVCTLAAAACVAPKTDFVAAGDRFRPRDDAGTQAKSALESLFDT